MSISLRTANGIVLKEIVVAIHLDEDKVKKIIRFFARYGFVQFNKAQNRVKIEPQLREIVLSSMPVEERVPVILMKKVYRNSW